MPKICECILINLNEIKKFAFEFDSIWAYCLFSAPLLLPRDCQQCEPCLDRTISVNARNCRPIQLSLPSPAAAYPQRKASIYGTALGDGLNGPQNRFTAPCLPLCILLLLLLALIFNLYCGTWSSSASFELEREKGRERQLRIYLSAVLQELHSGIFMGLPRHKVN